MFVVCQALAKEGGVEPAATWAYQDEKDGDQWEVHDAEDAGAVKEPHTTVYTYTVDRFGVRDTVKRYPLMNHAMALSKEKRT